METVFYIFAKAVSLYLGVVSLAMLLRVILSFFTSGASAVEKVCFILTEPFVLPIRLIMARLNVGQNSPIDIPFFIAYLLIGALQTILPII